MHQIHSRYEGKKTSKHKRNLAITGGVTLSVIASPVIAAVSVGKIDFSSQLCASLFGLLLCSDCDPCASIEVLDLNYKTSLFKIQMHFCNCRTSYNLKGVFMFFW